MLVKRRNLPIASDRYAANVGVEPDSGATSAGTTPGVCAANFKCRGDFGLHSSDPDDAISSSFRPACLRRYAGRRALS
jgi:hypothetical protein